MTSTRVAFDSGPLTANQRRIGLTAIGGYFVDGYDLLVLSGALLAIVPQFGLNAHKTGLLTATAFAAMALGSLCSGPLTDRFGRRPVFFATMIAFIVASLATLAVTQLWQLILLRALVGLAIGGDMPPSAALITEFIPRRRRGSFTALGGVAWTAGGATAIGVTLLLFKLSGGTDPWRIALASGAVPALILLVLRHRTPESPYWLAEHGRQDEALAAWHYAGGHTGQEGDADEPVMPPVVTESATSGSSRTGFRALVTPPFWVLILCLAVYWGLNNLYGSAITLYQPTLIARLLDNPGKYTPLVISLLFQVVAVLLGLFVCLFLIETWGRRSVALASTFLVGLGGVVVYAGIHSVPLTLVGFGAMIVLLNGGASLAFYVWAPELFPTRIRGRAVGVINMVGKSGSVISTLALPTLFANIGTKLFLLIAAAAAVNVVLIGLLAPETKNRSLADLESGVSRRQQVRARRNRVPEREPSTAAR